MWCESCCGATWQPDGSYQRWNNGTNSQNRWAGTESADMNTFPSGQYFFRLGGSETTHTRDGEIFPSSLNILPGKICKWLLTLKQIEHVPSCLVCFKCWCRFEIADTAGSHSYQVNVRLNQFNKSPSICVIFCSTFRHHPRKERCAPAVWVCRPSFYVLIVPLHLGHLIYHIESKGSFILALLNIWMKQN